MYTRRKLKYLPRFKALINVKTNFKGIMVVFYILRIVLLLLLYICFNAVFTVKSWQVIRVANEYLLGGVAFTQ